MSILSINRCTKTQLDMDDMLDTGDFTICHVKIAASYSPVFGPEQEYILRYDLRYHQVVLNIRKYQDSRFKIIKLSIGETM